MFFCLNYIHFIPSPYEGKENAKHFKAEFVLCGLEDLYEPLF